MFNLKNKTKSIKEKVIERFIETTKDDILVKVYRKYSDFKSNNKLYIRLSFEKYLLMNYNRINMFVNIEKQIVNQI